MAANQNFAQRVQLAHEVRRLFLQEATSALEALVLAVQDRLTALLDEAGAQRQRQSRRDAWTLYQRVGKFWLRDTQQAWQAALSPAQVKPVAKGGAASFELVDEGVVENRILAARLAVAITERAGGELEDLRLRIRKLEGLDDAGLEDILSPDLLCNTLLEAWTAQQLSQETWGWVSEVVQALLIVRLRQAYAGCNAFLIEREVLPAIGLGDRFRRATPTPVSDRPRSLQAGLAEADRPRQAAPPAAPRSPRTGSDSTSQGGAAGLPLRQASARQGAQKVLSQLQRILQAAPRQAFESTRPMTSTTGTGRPASARASAASALAAALAAQTWAQVTHMGAAPASPEPTRNAVADMAAQLRETTEDLKGKAETQSEKATVEVVALMFQAILQEDRIPPGIRVWFARLQIPVLRLALAEPEFFGDLDHPARQLIDRMGSCALGFDASGINSAELETEVKRVVQVIEQYPETGKRVYELVHEEFKKFLARFLTGSAVVQKVVSVAQQIEQKETLTIQYTIELRNMLRDIPVRDEVRNFLFKVWAEVLAVAAVGKGAQHADTLGFKKSAADLIWAVSAKPSRADRAQVIQGLPLLLQNLRVGMALLGLPVADQEAHLKGVSATLADAFLSKTQAISREQIEELAARLSRLEDFVSDEITEDLPLDAQSIEMMLGLEDSTIDIVTDGGSPPNPEMLEWAQSLTVGAWFTLDFHGSLVRVQYMWRSERGHLNLFASNAGHSYLIQAGRLAGYLHSGLLKPDEDEALTVRASRDALSKLQADPARLLA